VAELPLPFKVRMLLLALGAPIKPMIFRQFEVDNPDEKVEMVK
jgi:hypothetical protein